MKMFQFGIKFRLYVSRIIYLNVYRLKKEFIEILVYFNSFI